MYQPSSSTTGSTVKEALTSGKYKGRGEAPRPAATSLLPP